MKKSFIYTFLFISIGFSLNSSIIDGYVYDSDGKSISNVEVYIEELSIGSVTDSSGYFQIMSSDLLKKQDSFFLTVSHIGYISKKVNTYSSANINVYLEKESLNSDQIVVTALGYKSYIKDTPNFN